MIDRRRLLLLGPLGGAAILGAGFWAILDRMGSGSFDPHRVPSPLLGQQVPEFALPGFSRADLVAQHRPVLVNFFASWCVPCVAEAPELATLGREAPIWGIAYKDKPGDVARYLAQHGNPYARIAHDDPGRVAIDWGVYGVPETFLVDAAGVIRWKFAGALTPEIVAGELRPALARVA